jgi:hypothetical protein
MKTARDVQPGYVHRQVCGAPRAEDGAGLLARMSMAPKLLFELDEAAVDVERG